MAPTTAARSSRSEASPALSLRLAVAVDGPLGTPDAEALASVLAAEPDLVLDLVGPLDSLPDGFDPARTRLVPAAALDPAGPAPADLTRAVRAQRRAAVRVAAETVVAGHADALLGLTGVAATEAALRFAQRLLPGATAPIRAAVLGIGAGRLLLADLGSASGGGPDLDQIAAAAGAATTALGLPGGVARLDVERTGPPPAAGALIAPGPEARAWLAGFEAGLQLAAAGALRLGILLLGVPAVAVVPATGQLGAGAALAAAAVRGSLVDAQADAFATLVAHRRAEAGLP